MVNLDGSTESKNYVAIGMSNEVTADYFVRSIAKLHQKLSIIVHYFNFCYSFQFMLVTIAYFTHGLYAMFGQYVTFFSSHPQSFNLTNSLFSLVPESIFSYLFLINCIFGLQISSEVRRKLKNLNSQKCQFLLNSIVFLESTNCILG